MPDDFFEVMNWFGSQGPGIILTLPQTQQNKCNLAFLVRATGRMMVTQKWIQAPWKEFYSLKMIKS